MGLTAGGAPARRSAAPALSAVGVGALLGAGVLGLVVGSDGFVADRTLVLLTALGYGSFGSWVWARAVPIIGRRMTWVAAAAALNWLAQAWSGGLVGSWASQWTWFIPVLLVPLVLCRFPDGALPRGPARVLEPVLWGFVVLVSVSLALASLGAPRTLVADPGTDRPPWSGVLVSAAIIASAGWALSAIVLLVFVAVTAVRHGGTDRSRLLTIGIALLVTLAGMVGLIIMDALVFQVLVALALPVGLGAAVLRYALYDLDLLVHRYAVWLVLTVVLVAATAGALWLTVDLAPASLTRGLQIAVLTGLVVVFDPVRRAAQRSISRLLFGQRDAPAEALTVLGRGLGSATAQQSREELCRSVATTLALPWVGLRRGEAMVAAWGRPTSTPLEVPLAAGAGALLVCPRRAGERFAGADLRMMEAMASQVEVAVRALDVADELQAARGRLILSREEERKRLRNDLHDGVGPALAGVRMQVRALLRHDTDRWQRLDDDLGACTAEITRVIEGLRPPALDDGLAQALRREAARWSGGSTRVRIHDELDPDRPLPAAVETAVYRIAGEAISNAIRHGQARAVDVELAGRQDGTAGVVTLHVHDDGSGVVKPRDGGVGLGSMRNRAEELGGSFEIVDHPERGTSLTALIPLNPDEVPSGQRAAPHG